MKVERRANNRVSVKIPVELKDGSWGVTRDANSTGVYFECDGEYAPGSEIGFVLKFNNSEQAMLCDCRALVLRVERHEGRTGVAVHILECRFLPAEASARELAHTL